MAFIYIYAHRNSCKTGTKISCLKIFLWSLKNKIQLALIIQGYAANNNYYN